MISNFIVLGRFDEAEQARKELEKSILTILLHFTGFFLGAVRRDQTAMDHDGPG